MSNQYLGEWTERIKKHLVGRRIVDVEYMTSKEAEKSGWYARPICLLLDNNHWIVPMADDEGNDGGALHYFNPDKDITETIGVLWND